MPALVLAWATSGVVMSAQAGAGAGSASGVMEGSPFGPQVTVFAPGMPAAAMQARIDAVYAEQARSEFGAGRFAFLFLPGEYRLDVPVGFYTEVMGLGATPDAAHITGDVHADASAPHNNATTTFWRAAENFSVTPTGGVMQWAVSQAVPFRRMHVRGDMVLNQQGGWASGGWMSDSVVDGTVASGSQQQWIARNSAWGRWTGSNWNMVFVGDRHAPAGEWPKPPYTKVATTPVVRETPYLRVDAAGKYSVVVPGVRRNSVGVSWGKDAGAEAASGRVVPLSKFYIARPERDTAVTINAALRQGKDLLLTPGTYDLTEPLRVTRKGTVVLGLGFATLHPTHGTAAMVVSDMDGITVSGLLFDAGAAVSPVLLEVGEGVTAVRHAADPISLSDVFFRVGGAAVGKMVDNLVINSNDVLVDHTWIWRADHGAGVGWESNVSANGLTVNGANVTVYGLFVEHHQHFQTVWNGEGGRTYFYQSEIPYDVPTQAVWRSAPGTDGWASYKVADGVRDHKAWGLGVYSVFRQPDVVLSHAIETPVGSGIRFEHMMTVALDTLGSITHVVDDTGVAAVPKPRTTPRVDVFPVPGATSQGSAAQAPLR